MRYRADKQVVTAHTDGHTDRQTDAGNDNTRMPKLASDKKKPGVISWDRSCASELYICSNLCSCVMNLTVIMWLVIPVCSSVKVGIKTYIYIYVYIKWKHFPRCWPFVWEFPTQRLVTRNFDVSLICAWINGWVNNREAGDLRRNRTYGGIMQLPSDQWSQNLTSVNTSPLF